jgi:cytochrome c553
MPAIVARGSLQQGKGPPLLPCALCHLPNGAGHVESASLAGLPAEYIERQFVDWRSGARKLAVGDAQTIALLTAMKRGYSSGQVRAAARYFASLQPRRWVRVVETQTVPASAVDSQTLMRLATSPARTEPLGERIVELPEEPVGLISRDAHSHRQHRQRSSARQRCCLRRLSWADAHWIRGGAAHRRSAADIPGSAALGLSKRRSNSSHGRADARGHVKAHTARYALHCSLRGDAAALTGPRRFLIPRHAGFAAAHHAGPARVRSGAALRP